MEKSQSGLSRERLAEILLRVREIALMSDDLAIEPLDELLATVQDEAADGAGEPEGDWQSQSVSESMEGIRVTITRVRAASAIPGRQLLWDAQSLLEEVDNLERCFAPAVRTEYKEEFAALRAEAKLAAKEAEHSAHEKLLQEYATQVIHNSSSVKSVLSGIDNSLDSLSKLGPIPEQLAVTARQGKERAARYRAQKRLDEAVVSEAGGNARKADKLRKEATALLAQDWAQAFPGEPLPPVTSG